MRDPNRLIQDVAFLGALLVYLGWRWRCRKRQEEWVLEGKKVDRSELDEVIEELNGECRDLTFIVNRIVEVTYEGRTLRLVDAQVAHATASRYTRWTSEQRYLVVVASTEADWCARQSGFALLFQGSRYAVFRVEISKVMKGVKGIGGEV